MKKRIIAGSLICLFLFSLISLSGCGDTYTGIPVIFGGKGKLDPGKAGAGSGDLSLTVSGADEWGSTVYVDGAGVSIDGSSVGTTSYGYLNLYGIASGPHLLKITHSNYDDYTAIVTINANQTIYLDVTMTQGTTGDSYEPNDDYSSASDLTSYVSWQWDSSEGAYVWACTVSANISPSGDHDWYKIWLDYASPQKIILNLTGIPSGCDYNLKLYDYTGSVTLGSSTNSGTATEAITWSSSWQTSNWYYIQVYPYSGSSESNYSLSVKYRN